MTQTRPSPILDSGGRPHEVAVAETSRYRSHPAWMGNVRHWEAADTTRLNSAHWTYAQDTAINAWLSEHLSTLRARSIYESRQNAMVAGVIRTHADDVVGPDGPMLQVQSDDDRYSEALEAVWRDWWAAPTLRGNISGAALLKLWVWDWWVCGESFTRIYIDPEAEGPVPMQLWPVHPRRVASPVDRTGDPNVVMGIEFDDVGRAVAYYVQDAPMNGQATAGINGQRWLANSMIHDFVAEEADQARGFPWLTPGLNPAAEIRDYDDEVLDAARQQADQATILASDHPDAPFWNLPESTAVQRRQITMAPPGWTPKFSPATQPPVQYVDYRSERQREIGRAVSMPLHIIRLDASKHNYASARLDTQGYDRANASTQLRLSGTEQSTGTLSRIADEVADWAKFSVPALRKRPPRVWYEWTWKPRKHVDPAKEGIGETIGLQNLTVLFSDALAARGTHLDRHLIKLKRELKLIKEAGLPIPGEWIKNTNALMSMLATETDANANTGANADGQPVTASA